LRFVVGAFGSIVQNPMRETIDQGMANTEAGGKAATVTPAFAASAPPPDPNAAREIDQQQQIAAAAGKSTWERPIPADCEILALRAAERHRFAVKRTRSRRGLEYTPCSRSPDW
jgi:hypothetical protein